VHGRNHTLTPRKVSERSLILLLAATTATGPVALNIYLPVLPLVQADFGATVAATNITVTAALVAFAIGLLCWGPLSDHFGRRPMILTGIAIGIVGNILALAAPTIHQLALGRVIQALGSAAGVTVARATVADSFKPARLAHMIAYLTMVMVIANSLAPEAGGLLSEVFGWRAVFAGLLTGNLVLWTMIWRFFPESAVQSRERRPHDLVTDLFTLIRNPAFSSLAVISGSMYAVFFVFVAMMPYVFKTTLGHSAADYGRWYLLIAVGYFTGNWCVTRYTSRMGGFWFLRTGVLVSAAAGIIGWGLVARGFWTPFCLFAPWFFILLGQGLALPNLTASAVSVAPGSAGAAAGLLGFIQQIVGAASLQAMSVTTNVTPVPIITFCAIVNALTLIGLMIFRRVIDQARPAHAG